MVAKDESLGGLVGSGSSLAELSRDRLESEVIKNDFRVINSVRRVMNMEGEGKGFIGLNGPTGGQPSRTTSVT